MYTRHITSGSAIVTALALSLSCAFTSPIASAHPTPMAAGNTTTAQSFDYAQLSEEDLQQLERDVEILFTEHIQLTDDDTFVVNSAKALDVGGEKYLADLQALVDVLNLPDPDIAENSRLGSAFSGKDVQPMGAEEFAICMIINGLGLPAFTGHGGLKQAIKDGIRAWNWKLTARTVARIIGSQAVKALGGPVGIAGVLAVVSYNCRNEL